MSTYLKEKPRVSSPRGNCESPSQDQKIYIRDNLVNLILVFLVPVVRTFWRPPWGQEIVEKGIRQDESKRRTRRRAGR